MSAPDLTTSCVVIGAGQAGLSVAFYLRRLGLEPGEEFVVLDRGPRTGGAWQHRWEALRLGSAHRVNDLPGMDELKGAGLLSARMPSNFAVPQPAADPDTLTDDEDPLTDIDLEELGLLTPRVTDD